MSDRMGYLVIWRVGADKPNYIAAWTREDAAEIAQGIMLDPVGKTVEVSTCVIREEPKR